MKSEIKKCYRYLDLPLDSTKDDVKLRQKVMIKMLRAKAIDKHKNYDKEIERVNFSALTLLDFIDKNGVQEAEKFSFRPSIQDIYGEVFTLFILIILCATSFLILI
ncbi:MAG: hypothetical protein IKA36_06495 [Clostridia bacterium]|nr:hypothetical protein [Clostridia bacterium]